MLHLLKGMMSLLCYLLDLAKHYAMHAYLYMIFDGIRNDGMKTIIIIVTPLTASMKDQQKNDNIKL